jgi:Tol biopolymer transport system component
LETSAARLIQGVVAGNRQTLTRRLWHLMAAYVTPDLQWSGPRRCCIPTSGPSSDPERGLVAAGDRLDSWKEIATYLKRSVRTVIRWEQDMGLPVRRHKTGGVYASRPEIDAWWAAHQKEIENTGLPAGGKPAVRRVLVPVVAAVALVTISAAGWIAFRRDSRPAPKLVPLTTYPGIEGPPSLSPNGNQVVFRWNDHINLKQVDSEAHHQLTDTPGRENAPTWSPDGRYIAYIRNGREIWRMSSLGGDDTKIAETLSPPTYAEVMTWTPDNRSLVVSELISRESIIAGLVMITVETGERRWITSPHGPGIGDRMPAISPDGKMLAFTRCLADHPSMIYVIPLAGGEARQVVQDSGWIDGFAWTPDGREFIFSSSRTGTSRLWRIPAVSSTRVSPSLVEDAGADAQYPSFSRPPPGTPVRLAYQRSVRDFDILRAEVSGEDSPAHVLKPSEPFVPSTRSELWPQYSPDGSRVAFISDRSGELELWTCNNDGSNPKRLTSIGPVSPGAWSPDGRQIGFHALTGVGGAFQNYRVDADGGSPRRISTDLKQIDACPSWSQDGLWIYFASARNQRPQIWRMPSGGGPATQITTGGGMVARDAKDGLVYYNKVPEDGPGLWSVPRQGGEEVKVLAEPFWGRWALNKKGIYFVDFGVPAASPRPVKFFSFATRRTTQIGTVEAAVTPVLGGGLTISPDGHWLLYAKLERDEADLMLVDNFR